MGARQEEEPRCQNGGGAEAVVMCERDCPSRYAKLMAPYRALDDFAPQQVNNRTSDQLREMLPSSLFEASVA